MQTKQTWLSVLHYGSDLLTSEVTLRAQAAASPAQEL